MCIVCGDLPEIKGERSERLCQTQVVSEAAPLLDEMGGWWCHSPCIEPASRGSQWSTSIYYYSVFGSNIAQMFFCFHLKLSDQTKKKKASVAFMMVEIGSDFFT